MLRSYTAADMLTIGNAACGTIAIFLCLDYLATGRGPHLWVAFLRRIGDALWLGSLRMGPAALHPLSLIYAASGSAMISATLRIPKP